jgi:hypothetical protein
MNCLMKYAKSPEPTIAEKFKFLLKDPTANEGEYTAVCELFPESVPKLKQQESLSMAMAKKTTTTVKKPNAPVKITFEPEFYEKGIILPTISDKMKIIAINYSFERMLRHNIIECMNKIAKIEGEKDLIKEEFEEFYQNKFVGPFITHLSHAMKKEVLKFDVQKPATITNDP